MIDLDEPAFPTHIPGDQDKMHSMKTFLEKTFGPTELAIVDAAFSEWIDQAKVEKQSPEAELAAAIVINLFREGNDTIPAMRKAISVHRGLIDLRCI
ncbi:hypothetical protein GCM10010924_36000 [Rhizobium wenxiniae]|uniref:Uncharacterized protein n=1 Tax=Rhizobium wenxiniae TaxID=1737357 RepID=A0A7W9Y8Y1_9HYPH|nr:hypothetical protein [Rhizobium wenxiniae]MBB6164017.1 hypothetical protein [Rhizobium wenxiniae]GGG04237.1 hypothetical protein GCM10010924_36000 [Rhizobium wenxiniae]